MRPDRPVGYLRPPTSDEVAAYAAVHHLHLGPDELDRLVAAVAGSLRAFTRIEELGDPVVALRHLERDPGRRPRPDEDPYNAFIRFCEIRGASEGPLAGRTVGVKDCIAVAGVPTTNGGRRTPVAVPVQDAAVVERILDAGGVITGKTNLEDLGLGFGEGSAFGPSRNPVDPRYSTGGSSSGSAAAVAAGMVDLALGADEGGSVRVPAAWCGLVGMKATHGLVPSYGLTYMDHAIDHIGPITKTVEDNARLLEVIAGSDWRDPQWVRAAPVPGEYLATAGLGVGGLRIGVVPEALEPSGCSDGVLSAFDRGLAALSGLGASVVPAVSIPLWAEVGSMALAALSLGLYGMSLSHGAGFGHLGRVDAMAVAVAAAQARTQADDLPPQLQAMLVTTEHLLQRHGAVPFARAQNLRLEVRRQLMAALDQVDVLVTPTTARVAFELLDRRASPGEMTARLEEQIRSVGNAVQLDLSGHPAITVPCGTAEHGLPVGLQVIGSHFAEERCYQVAFALESALG